MPLVRLVHCADVHLDTAVAQRHDASRRRIASAVRDSVDALVALCLRENAHALLIAGDLLDERRLSPSTARFLASRLERLGRAGIVTCLAAGNHDPGPALRAALPASACEFFDAAEPRAVRLRDMDGRPLAHVIGCGHPRPDESRDLAAAVAAHARTLPDDGLPRVGLVHTQVLDARRAGQHRPYAPTSRATLAAAPVDYWALGHVHQRQVVLDEPLACYPGNLQGRHRREGGPKGALVVELGDGRARARFEALDGLRFDVLRLDDLAELTSVHGLHERLCAVLGQERPAAPERHVTVELVGACALAGSLGDRAQREELAEQLADEFGLFGLELDVRALRPQEDLDALRNEPHLLGRSLALLETLREDAEALDRLAPTPLAASADLDPAARRAYLRGLLDDLDGLAVDALRAGDP